MAQYIALGSIILALGSNRNLSARATGANTARNDSAKAVDSFRAAGNGVRGWDGFRLTGGLVKPNASLEQIWNTLLRLHILRQIAI